MKEIHPSLAKPVSVWSALHALTAILGDVPSESYLKREHPALWAAVERHGGMNRFLEENQESIRILTDLAEERHYFSIVQWERAVEGNDGAAREKLLALYRPIAQKLASRLYSRKLRGTWSDWISVQPEDLQQEGLVALNDKLADYDPSKSKFQSFANSVMYSAMQHHLRDKALLIHEPAWIQELRSKLGNAHAEFLAKHSRKPTFKELAKAANVTVESVIEGMTHYQPVTLNEQERYAPDHFESIALKLILYKALREHVKLSKNEAIALSMSADGHSPEEIAGRLNVSYASAGSFTYQAKKKVRSSLLFKHELGLD